MMDLRSISLCLLTSCVAFGCANGPDVPAGSGDQPSTAVEPAPEPAPEPSPVGRWVLDLDRTAEEAQALDEANRPPIDNMRTAANSMWMTLSDDGVVQVNTGVPGAEQLMKGRWTEEGTDLKIEIENSPGGDPSRAYMNGPDEIILEDDRSGSVWKMVMRRSDG